MSQRDYSSSGKNLVIMIIFPFASNLIKRTKIAANVTEQILKAFSGREKIKGNISKDTLLYQRGRRVA